MNGKLRKLTTSLVLQVFWDDNASVVKKSVFPGGSSLSAQTYNSLADVQKFITLGTFIISRSASNRWKDQKVFYNSCIWFQVRFPSDQSKICTYWLLLAVKSDSASVSKFSFWSFLGEFEDAHLSWYFRGMMWCLSCSRYSLLKVYVLNPELRRCNLGAALSSFECHCQSFCSFCLSKAPDHDTPSH
jgi:hypothetical protein